MEYKKQLKLLKKQYQQYIFFYLSLNGLKIILNERNYWKSILNRTNYFIRKTKRLKNIKSTS